MDVLWKQHITHRLDPAKYLPIEIVNLIFSFVVYHVVELEPEDPFRPPGSAAPREELTHGFRDAPLILAAVSRDWCRIAVNYPPIWSTIVIDQSEDDYLERIHLFLDRSGKELLDIILLGDLTLTTHLKDILIKYAGRFRTLIGPPVASTFPRPLLEPVEASPGFVNWSAYNGRRISSLPIPKCLHRVQLDRMEFESESLIQFTFFHNLESLFISIILEPKDTQWDKKLQFERLRHLHLRISSVYWPDGSTLTSTWIECLECPALVDLRLFYSLKEAPSEEMYAQLEATLLRFRYLQKLQVHINAHKLTSQGSHASRFQNMRPSTFEGSLESVHFRFNMQDDEEGVWAAAFTERFFTVFIPKTNLGWQYAQFPSPAITANLKTMHIGGSIERVQSALVAPEMAKLEFPFLEELYLRQGEPKWMDVLHAPHLTYLHIQEFIPSDLRHISNSIISSVRLNLPKDHPGPWEIFLPPVSKLEVDLQIKDIFHLNVHPSQIHAVTINGYWNERVTCPPYWTMNHISRVLGTITALNLECSSSESVFQDPSETMLPFIKPFVCLEHLTLFATIASEPICIDQLAQHFVDPDFLPKLKCLSIPEYLSWPNFFQYVRQRQLGFLTGNFQTALKRITISKHAHGALLEHLRESLGGKYIGIINTPPRRKGSKEWPTRPFDFKKLDMDGLLCCYACHKAGLEIGCMMSPPENSQDLGGPKGPKYVHVWAWACERHSSGWPLNTVFAP